ncbi:hypothetical protein K438DRAFT_1960950 [Mycena galopus ATCC 62051]|nr:hypothetical protein K438DRAFT_1960950 [Mycena galopus ATCC 62051]
MTIPQELIDEIIGEFDISQKYDAETEATLKSCALIARPFLRSAQSHLSARISFLDYRSRWKDNRTPPSVLLAQRLSALLHYAPHIAIFIRTLDLCYPSTRPEADLVPRILSAVPALNSLVLRNSAENGPFPVNPSTITVFSLQSLRRVELRGYQFANALELESLLGTAICLKELILRDIYFEDMVQSNADAREAGCGGRVKLENLVLEELYHSAVETMFDSFTTVDIRHLKSLAIFDSGMTMTELLRVNARSIQQLKLGNAYNSRSRWDHSSDAPMITDAPYLLRVDFEVDAIHALLPLIPPLGDLRTLKALKTIRIALCNGITAKRIHKGQWEQFDALLQPLPNGVTVEIYAASGPFWHEAVDAVRAEDLDLIKQYLPLLSRRGTLHVYPNPR